MELIAQIKKKKKIGTKGCNINGVRQVVKVGNKKKITEVEFP